MGDTIRVHVVQEGDRPNLSMRYHDPISGRLVKRTAGTANRKEAERHGRVFPVDDADIRVSKVISDIGRAARVMVSAETREVDGEWRERIKYASAHDLRRSFGLRWSRWVMPPELMELMRHSAIATTMKFYVGRDAKSTARSL